MKVRLASFRLVTAIPLLALALSAPSIASAAPGTCAITVQPSTVDGRTG